ncbi:FliI/YscN family ATPase [Shouchella lehensis]|uniref:Flagellum-specific ATP synthase n=2 Tax=Shouchella lehensis TaxID=300825 RepID=A0A060LUC5_9BACI|nr:FliI/YscN family ATPase [Shouchella lehensis]AIC94831.1 flagellum-specific ATP synthase [Shouchella lehensis G1]MBG9784313.1 ATP synthase [Shouchella lehensis]RQW20676.1 flagellar protein export ATPase FliI [Bacillus sp. C1-1]TES50696.1 flagellar protein export ATPase FliI [Shouchella lehensis]
MWKQLIDQVEASTLYKWYGQVKKVTGLTIESSGPRSFIGELCYIWTGQDKKKKIRAEVVGFDHDRVLLMPLDRIDHIELGSLVETTKQSLTIPVGPALIGKLVDGVGTPFDSADGFTDSFDMFYPADSEPPPPMTRPRISETMSVGVKAIDSMLTMGKGQRVGIFAGSGVGKSTLMSMIAKQSDADVNVIALIGERGREVRDFIERDLGSEGLKKSVLIVVTSDQPPLQRVKGALTATAIAEYFRDQGMSVNLMMDSVTRFAMAHREIGLAIGEPPTSKGYPPSVFAKLPQLLERAGTSEKGTITAFYTVLVDGDDMNEPIADAVRGILDGHFILDRGLANKGQFPAIHLLKSVSRLMSELVSDEHARAAKEMRRWLADYEETEDLIQLGAYKQGASPAIDRAIEAMPQLLQFLSQRSGESYDFSSTFAEMMHLVEGVKKE